MRRLSEAAIIDDTISQGTQHFLLTWDQFTHEYDRWLPIHRIAPAKQALKVYLLSRCPKKSLKQEEECTESGRTESQCMSNALSQTPYRNMYLEAQRGPKLPISQANFIVLDDDSPEIVAVNAPHKIPKLTNQNSLKPIQGLKEEEEMKGRLGSDVDLSVENVVPLSYSLPQPTYNGNLYAQKDPSEEEEANFSQIPLSGVIKEILADSHQKETPPSQFTPQQTQQVSEQQLPSEQQPFHLSEDRPHHVSENRPFQHVSEVKPFQHVSEVQQSQQTLFEQKQSYQVQEGQIEIGERMNNEQAILQTPQQQKIGVQPASIELTKNGQDGMCIENVGEYQKVKTGKEQVKPTQVQQNFHGFSLQIQTQNPFTSKEKPEEPEQMIPKLVETEVMSHQPQMLPFVDQSQAIPLPQAESLPHQPQIVPLGQIESLPQVLPQRQQVLPQRQQVLPQTQQVLPQTQRETQNEAAVEPSQFLVHTEDKLEEVPQEKCKEKVSPRYVVSGKVKRHEILYIKYHKVIRGEIIYRIRLTQKRSGNMRQSDLKVIREDLIQGYEKKLRDKVQEIELNEYYSTKGIQA